MSAGHSFGVKATKQIAAVVHTVSMQVQNGPQQRGRWQKKTVGRGFILDANLPAASHALTGATSCLATLCDWDGEKYVETDEQEYVWNHSEAQNYEIDTFGSAIEIDGHLWFFGDCKKMRAR
jgi:hypothetical protein